MRRATALSLALVAPPVFADCPDAGDLARGITARMKAQPELLLFVREDGVLKRQLAEPEPGHPWRALYAHPLLPAEVGHPRAAARFAYAEDTAALDRLNLDGLWASALTVTLPAAAAPGDVELKGEVEARFLGMEEAVVGDCSYPGWLVAVEMRLQGQPGAISHNLYAPILGFVVRSREDGGVASIFPSMELVTLGKP